MTSLARFVADREFHSTNRFLRLLADLTPAWRTAAGKIPRSGRGAANKTLETIAQILALSPVSTAIDVRRMLPTEVVDTVGSLAGMADDQQATLSEISLQMIVQALHVNVAPTDRIAQLIGDATTHTLGGHRVQAAPLSTSAPLVDNYLWWLRTTTPDEIAAAEDRFGSPLLYLLARHALLHQYALTAETMVADTEFDVHDLLDRHAVIDLPGTLKRPPGALDLFGLPSDELAGSGVPLQPDGAGVLSGPTIDAGAIPPGVGVVPAPAGTMTGDRPPLGQATQQFAASIAANTSVGLGFSEQPGAPAPTGRGRRRTAAPPNPSAVEAAQVLASLAHLGSLPSATLDRLLRETVDLASHRLDAWITSMATARLAHMRAARPGGAHLGAYGVVFNIVPVATAQAGTPPGSPPATAPAAETANQGFVLAPSLGHAATAAVLRSAHVAHGDQSAFAVGLESRRVRRAKLLLDGVRTGQPLAALLGYQIERALLDAGQATAIAKLRDAAPLRTSAAAPVGTAFEHIAPRDVVDGVAITRSTFTMPALTNAERTAVNAAVGDARDALDATGDLLLAEGVHQLVSGSPARAAAAMHAAAGTGPPPDRYEVIESPRFGIGVTQRLLLVSDVDHSDWSAGHKPTPRAIADPLLEGWAATRLGKPANYSAIVKFSDSDNQPLGEVEVRVEDLALNALDAVAMSSPAATGQLCELERRILDRALSPEMRPADVAPDAAATIAGRADHSTESKRTPLSDLIVAACACGSLLGSCRIPGAHELDAALDFDADAYDINELAGRTAALIAIAEQARDTLRDILDGVADADVDLDRLIAALRTASLLAAAALPEVADLTHPLARQLLVVQGRGTATELDRRISGAVALVRGRNVGSGNATTANQHREIIQLLVDWATPPAPRMRPAVADALGGLLTAGPSLGAGVTSAANRSSVLRTFLAKAAGVRAGVTRLCETETLAAALGCDPIELRVAQHGMPPGAAWVGLPGIDIPGGVTSIVAAGPAAFAAAPVAALIVDDWTETVPRGTRGEFTRRARRTPQLRRPAIDSDRCAARPRSGLGRGHAAGCARGDVRAGGDADGGSTGARRLRTSVAGAPTRVHGPVVPDQDLGEVLVPRQGGVMTLVTFTTWARLRASPVGSVARARNHRRR